MQRHFNDAEARSEPVSLLYASEASIHGRFGYGTASHYVEYELDSRRAARQTRRITPPPAPSPRKLTLRGGFTVLDPQQRRLHDHARAQGYSDLASHLQARCQQQASPAQLAASLPTPHPSPAACWTPQASPRHPAR